MHRLPNLERKHKICVICEGYEDFAYFNRLLELNVWNSAYEFYPINVKSASNISARFQDVFQNDKYELVLIFCDTDKSPYREYIQVKQKINGFLNKADAAERLIIFANPCTMQIILSHFGEVSLKNQGKRTNSQKIEELTGVKDYDAHETQIQEICRQICRRTYEDMRSRVKAIRYSDETSGSTNFFTFLEHFEDPSGEWISEIKDYLKEEDHDQRS